MRPYEKMAFDTEVIDSMIRTVRKTVAFISKGVFRLRRENTRRPFVVAHLEPSLRALAGLFRQLYFTVKQLETSHSLELLQSTASQLLGIKFELLTENLDRSDSFRRTVKVATLLADKLWTWCWGVMTKLTITRSRSGVVEAVEDARPN